MCYLTKLFLQNSYLRQRIFHPPGFELPPDPDSPRLKPPPLPEPPEPEPPEDPEPPDEPELDPHDEPFPPEEPDPELPDEPEPINPPLFPEPPEEPDPEFPEDPELDCPQPPQLPQPPHPPKPPLGLFPEEPDPEDPDPELPEDPDPELPDEPDPEFPEEPEFDPPDSVQVIDEVHLADTLTDAPPPMIDKPFIPPPEGCFPPESPNPNQIQFFKDDTTDPLSFNTDVRVRDTPEPTALSALSKPSKMGPITGRCVMTPTTSNLTMYCKRLLNLTVPRICLRILVVEEKSIDIVILGSSFKTNTTPSPDITNHINLWSNVAMELTNDITGFSSRSTLTTPERSGFPEAAICALMILDTFMSPIINLSSLISWRNFKHPDSRLYCFT
ncbi:hypothetical protein HHI36_020341 [Cryptolaemus montrouzieri]|uniref:Uncharacterized protein n=1 Tax=Cryptolaemus montrouzieri TaxID=559131 RepID=A0ABD2N9Y9_9CUCU